MIYPSADKLETWGSKYSLVVLAAKRAKQIKNGAPPLIDTDSRNPLTIALEEIASGKVDCRVSEADLIITPRDEPELAQLLALRKRELEEEPVEVVATSDEEDEILLEELEEDEEEEEEEDLVIYSTDDEDEEEEAEPDNVVDVDAEIGDNLLEDESKKKSDEDDEDIDLDVEVEDTDDFVDEESEE